MNQINLLKEDIAIILEFANKYPEANFITISSNEPSGIGQIIKVSVETVINGDDVTITKTISDEKFW